MPFPLSSILLDCCEAIVGKSFPFHGWKVASFGLLEKKKREEVLFFVSTLGKTGSKHLFRMETATQAGSTYGEECGCGVVTKFLNFGYRFVYFLKILSDLVKFSHI